MLCFFETKLRNLFKCSWLSYLILKHRARCPFIETNLLNLFKLLKSPINLSKSLMDKIIRSRLKMSTVADPIKNKGLRSGRSIQLENSNAFMIRKVIELKCIWYQYCLLRILCHGGQQANGFKTSAGNT